MMYGSERWNNFNDGYVKINYVVLCILRLPNYYVITFDGILDALIRHFL